jgi:hypothetical protein
MKLKEFKNWINSLPDEFSDYVIEVVKAEGQLDDDFSYRLDAPIIGMSVDETYEHVLIFIEEEDDSEEESE